MWLNTYQFKGHLFQITDAGNGFSLMLNQYEIKHFGDDIHEFIEWASENIYELGEAEEWRTNGYHYKEQLSKEPLRRFVKNQFLSDEERREIQDILDGNVPYDYFNTPKKSKDRKKQSGYIYLITSKDGLYKIGLSKDVMSRIKTLGVTLPFEIEPIHTIKTDDMVGLEKELHSRFESKRIRGEWFALETDDVEYIKSL